MDYPIERDIWRSNSSIKDVNHWLTYTGNLFIVVNTWVEPATFFEYDNIRIVNQCETDLFEECSRKKEFQIIV